LYNETDGNAVLPTPTLGVVGLIEDADAVVRRTFQSAGDAIVLLGTGREELGGSEYLKIVHGLVRGLPPALDLEREAAVQRVLVTAASRRLIRSAHDCAEGGLAVTVAESSFDTGLGADIHVAAVAPSTPGFGDVATLFGESATRVVVSATPRDVDELLSLAKGESVPAAVIGSVGGDRIRISIDGRVVVDEPLVEAEQIWANAIGRYFDRTVA